MQLGMLLTLALGPACRYNSSRAHTRQEIVLATEVVEQVTRCLQALQLQNEAVHGIRCILTWGAGRGVAWGGGEAASQGGGLQQARKRESGVDELFTYRQCCKFLQHKSLSTFLRGMSRG